MCRSYPDLKSSSVAVVVRATATLDGATDVGVHRLHVERGQRVVVVVRQRPAPHVLRAVVRVEVFVLIPTSYLTSVTFAPIDLELTMIRPGSLRSLEHSYKYSLIVSQVYFILSSLVFYRDRFLFLVGKWWGVN